MSKKFDDDFFGCAESCPKMRDRGLEIQKLNEKICAYKAKVRDLYQVDISDLKRTIRCLKERVEELDCENEFLTSRVEELEDNNNKLESLKQHLINHVSNKEAEIVNLKEENEKLKRENDRLSANLFVNCKEILEAKRHEYTFLGREEAEIVKLKEENEKLQNEIKYWKDKYEALDKDSTDGSYIYISIPKEQKVSNFEVYFQEENTSSIKWPLSPINPVITPTITCGSGTGGAE